MKKNNYIGIYYKDYDWALNQFNFLKKSLKDQIVKISCNNKYFHMTLKDGDYIDICPARSEALGRRHTHIYIQKGVDKDIYEVCIAPTFTPFRSEELKEGIFGVFEGVPIYVVDDFHNLENIILATDYYYEGNK